MKRDGEELNKASKKSKLSDDEEEEFDDEAGDNDDDDDDDDDFAQEDGNPGPGMVTSLVEAKKWWEGTDGFDFVNARKKINEDEGMRVDEDKGGCLGKIVKRSFGRGIVSYGKVVGWFPAEEDEELLYHVLHGDGDEEDLNMRETLQGIRWANEKADDEEEDEENEQGRAAAENIQASDMLSARQEVTEAQATVEAKRTALLNSLLKKTPKYKEAARDANEAAMRGVAFIFSLSRDPSNLANFGSEIFQTLCDISMVAPEPLRCAALQRVEVVSQLWKNKFQSVTDFAEDRSVGVKPDEVVYALSGLQCLERVGVDHVLKQQVFDYLKRANFTAANFLGFDVDRPNPLLDSKHRDERYTLLTSALNTAYLASKVGIPIGEVSGKVTEGAVLAHVRYLRPYVLPSASLDHDDWVDQITMIFNVVHMCSNFGELRLRVSLLPLEAAFLDNVKNMDHAIAHNDIHIIGEICHCLRVFGKKGEVLDKGLKHVLSQQHIRDGSWPTREGVDDGYTRYHAAMCGTMALYEPEFRGYGPGSSELSRLISKWNRRDKLTVSEESMPSSLSSVDSSYSSVSQGMNALQRKLGLNSGEAAGEVRLAGLLRWRQVVAEQSVEGYSRQTRKSSIGLGNMSAAGRSSLAARKRASELSKVKKPYNPTSDLLDTDEEGSIDDLL